MASTQEYPSRGLQIIVPLAAGGGMDTMGQILSQHLAESLKIPCIVENRPYESERDSTFVDLSATSPNVLVVHPSFPIKSTQDVVRIAKSQPRSLSYASAGNGSSVHLAGELFKYMRKRPAPFFLRISKQNSKRMALNRPGGASKQFRDFITSEIKKWGDIVKPASIHTG